VQRLSFVLLLAACLPTMWAEDTGALTAVGKGTGSGSSAAPCIVCQFTSEIEGARWEGETLVWQLSTRVSRWTAWSCPYYESTLRHYGEQRAVAVVDAAECAVHTCDVTETHVVMTHGTDYADGREDTEAVTSTLTRHPDEPTTVPCANYMSSWVLVETKVVNGSDPDATHTETKTMQTTWVADGFVE
jgi:hypothetical protein